MLKLLTFAIYVTLAYGASAQRNVKDSIIGTPWIGIHYGAVLPQGDLADRYGFMNQIGTMAGYKDTKNFYYCFDGNFIFGNRILVPDILHNLRDEKGNITDINGDIATIPLFVRGFNANLALGKLFPVLSPNINSGILVKLGGGYTMTKIRIESNDQVIPQVELEYKKGYDRYTYGFNLHQFVGYAYMGNTGVVNFYGGFYFQQGFTRNARDIFFDQPDQPVSKELRNDLMVGLRLGWFIPIYKRLPKSYYYN